VVEFIPEGYPGEAVSVKTCDFWKSLVEGNRGFFDVVLGYKTVGFSPLECPLQGSKESGNTNSLNTIFPGTATFSEHFRYIQGCHQKFGLN
jgi:hypothetical protein